MKKTATLTSLSGSLGTSVKIILTLLFLNFFTQNISAQTIKIDGLSNSTPGEWNQAGITHVQDAFGSGVVDDQFTEGSKDFFFAADWRWSISQTKAKNDLQNGAATILPAGSVLLEDGSVAPGGPFLVFAGDRSSNNGDAQIGFWFFQDGTAPVTQANGTKNFAPPKHDAPVIGDILVLADFTGGGRDANVIVLEWTPGTGTFPNSDNNFTQILVGAAVAENNAGTTPVPTGWNTVHSPYETNEFFEGYVNLAAFGAGSVCFSRFMLEARSSQSITASLDDFVGGALGNTPDCNITGNNTICAGSSTCFTASGGTGSFTYRWSGPGVAPGTTGAVICNLTAAGTYNVSVSNATGCVTTCSRTLIVNQPITCNVTGNNTICAGASASFTATAGGANYFWSGPGSFTGQGTNVISNLTVAGTYNVTITSSGGCTSTCNRALTVNQPITCNVTGNNTICQGGSASFTATAGGASYVWSGPGTFTGQGTNVISNLTATGTYNVTITSSGGCTSTCNRALIVNNTPPCEVTGNNTICTGATASFTATAGGTNYVWSGPGSFTGQGTNVISNLTVAGTYNVTITSSGGCTSTCQRTLTVNTPITCNVTGNNTICVGQSASFTATAGGSSYVWSGPGTFTGQGTNVISNLTAAGTYNVTITSSGGCTSTCNRTLTVNQNPSVNAGTDPAAQCRAATITNGSLVFGTNTFSVTGTVNAFTTPNVPAWTVQSKSDAAFNVSIVSPNSLTTNVEISGNVNGGSVTLRLTGTSNATPSCGTATDDVVLVLNPRPLIRTLIGSDFCPNVTTTGSVTLINSQSGVSYQLFKDITPTQAPKLGTNGVNLVWTGLDDGSYTVVGTVVATSCNSTSGPADVVENPVPEVSITPVADLCTTDNCVQLTALPAGGDFSGTGVNSSDQFCPAGLAPGAYTVTYSYTNAQGCFASTSISIDVISCEAALCTYTQGAFGNEGGNDCDGTTSMPTIELINQSIANWGGLITIGCGTKKVTIATGQAQCVIDKLPGGGPSKELDGDYTICNLPIEKMKNTLLAQTITLGLNLGITSPSALSDFALQAGTLYTADVVGGCGSEVPLLRECIYDPGTGALIQTINPYEERSFSQALIDAIEDAGYPKTVGGLFSLASDALCNKDGVAGTEQGVDLSEIGGAAGSINEIFDECRISQGWDLGPCPATQTIAPPRIIVSANAEAATIGKLKVSTYPNPYRSNVRFVIESPVSGQAILDVYNMAGQKVQTLFNGHIEANETRMIDYKPTVANGMMIYTLRIGNRQVTGKLIGLKQ